MRRKLSCNRGRTCLGFVLTLGFPAFRNNSKKRPLSVKTFDEVPVEKEKVLHEVREVTASFPSSFTDHQKLSSELCNHLVGENFKSGRRFGSGTSHPGLCDNKEGPAFLLINNLRRSSHVIALALIRLRGFIFKTYFKMFFHHKKVAAH